MVLLRPLSEAPPAFRRLAAVQALHAAGDAMVAVALANTLFFNVPIGEARDKVGLYLLLTMTPFAVLSPLVGPALDRRRGAYRVGILISAAGRAAMALLLATRTQGLSLYPLAFGLLVLSRAYGVSRSAIVPNAIGDHKPLIWANAWLAVISVAAAAVGAGVAAGLQHFVSTKLGLWLAATLFLVIVGPAFGLPKPEGEQKHKHVQGDYRALLSTRLLGGGVAMGASRACVGFLTFLLAFLLRASGDGTKGFATAVAAAGVGGFVGSAAAPALRKVLREPLLLFVSLVMMGVAALFASYGFSLAMAAMVSAVVGFGSTAGRLAFDSLVQRDAPEEIRGRTFARYETIFQLCWVAGAGTATLIPFHSRGGLRVLALICLGGIALSIYGLLVRGRLVDPALAALPEGSAQLPSQDLS
ncbi:MAG TPA: MFS transporter [Acidimicrobiales bacterium]|nr:MFS transporter [Acidimicrobiales bacterium]